MQIVLYVPSYVGRYSVAIMHVTVSVAIMQLEVAFNMWVIVFIVFMLVGVSVAVMHLVLSAVLTNYASIFGE